MDHLEKLADYRVGTFYRVSGRECQGVFQCRCSLDGLNIEEYRRALDQVNSDFSEINRIIVNLNEVRLLDNSGIGLLVSYFKRLRMNGGDLSVSELKGQPKEVFRLLRLDRAFEMYETLEQALSVSA